MTEVQASESRLARVIVKRGDSLLIRNVYNTVARCQILVPDTYFSLLELINTYRFKRVNPIHADYALRTVLYTESCGLDTNC